MAPVSHLLVAVALLSSLASAAGARAATAPAVPTAPNAGSAPVVELAHGGSELPPARQRAVEQALLAAADAAGVVVCRDNKSLSLPESAALDRVCATPGLPRLWWDAEIGTEKSGEVEVLDVFLKVAIARAPGPPLESPTAIVAPHPLLPANPANPANIAGAAGAQAAEREAAIYDGIRHALAAADDLRTWLAGLKERPELLRTRPAIRHRTATAAELRAWNEELQKIADLLIDDHYLEARDRATRLLKEDPTPEVASRARELLAKANTKLAQGAPPLPGALGEPGQIVIRPSQGSAENQRKRWERHFDVRVAKDDRLASGPEGRLAVSEDGVSFTRKGETRPDWSIAWSDLSAGHRADGLWDVPYPLALIEKSGRVRHLVRVDPAGKPLPGGAVLSALAEGRLASRKGYS